MHLHLKHHDHKKTEHHKKVLLTGASGFLASHILDQLLRFGYEVKATVRTEAKALAIRTKYSDFPLEVVIVRDMQATDAFDNVWDKHITAVFHTASPFYFPGEDHDNLSGFLNPAIKGTTNILASIKKFAPQVTHVVMTSSSAAIGQLANMGNPHFTHTEETWCDITWDEAVADPAKGYRGSKKFAEKAFWDFIRDEKPNFVGTTVCPPFLFGKVIQHVEDIEKVNESTRMIYDLLWKSDPKDTSSKFSQNVKRFLDVQDAAHAHILSIEKPETAGQRLLVVHGFYSQQQVLDIAHKDFPVELTGVAPIGQPGTGTAHFHELSPFDGSKTNQILGFHYTSLEATMIDCISSISQILEETNHPHHHHNRVGF